MPTVTLRIRENLWWGRRRTQPPPTERELRLPEGGIIELTFHREVHSCAVTSIEEEAVELAPIGDAPAIVNEDGGIGPHRMAAHTRLAVGQSLKLSTWVLDAGAIWEITVASIDG